jgi:hypothetical protein
MQGSIREANHQTGRGISRSLALPFLRVDEVF